MVMESTRQKKVARLVLKEVAEIINRKGREIAPGKMISVTQVRITPDLSLAKVYISIFPADKKEEILESIQEHSKNIRFELGVKVKMQLRIVPELAFYLDDSLDYIDNLDKLLKN
jgi:ribosome-binding factor A